MSHGSRLVPCSDGSPLFGAWMPHAHLKQLYYGPSCVEQHLLRTLPCPGSRVFIVTSQSLATKTPLIRQLETLLGEHHAGTFAGIRQHGEAVGVDQAFAAVVSAHPAIDTILSVGGGSAIDAAKVVSFRISQQRGGVFLTHLAIPTTLSAAECTPGGGFTRPDGTKEGFMAAGMGVSAIFYDPAFARYTPRRLLLGSGMRAVDHAVESVYHPNASLVPWKAMACWALGVLFQYLPQVADHFDNDPQQHGGGMDDDALTMLMLASFASSGFRGTNFAGGMGLSHSLGHALGSPYGIPHGETSCLTLAPVIRLLASERPPAASQISRFLLPAIGRQPTGDAVHDSADFAASLDELVLRLGLQQPSLSDRGVGRDQIPIIVERAVKGPEEKELRAAVRRLVEALF
ncbi:putative Maleylacetate reductase [Chaetomium strumarium]|uniref:Maleylacetate reductase n=1 Tax=Chaetomium strumarium TaxID=1170767 RepID=A0AAJ0GPV7_9PEZI|nr:putative Maleylacetate reductase [Chaetomium strumarium]